MSEFWAFTVVGLVYGCVYALTATGLVVTYTTSGIFNFAHGAIGMMAAFTYWQLKVAWGWPTLGALLLVLLVLAPLLGIVIERGLIRPLTRGSPDVAIVVTLGLLLAFMGIAQQVWNAQTTRILPPLFGPTSTINLGGVVVTAHELVVVCVAAAVAIALRLFFTRARSGVAMRAVVDDPDLVAMMGARPQRVAMLSWALGASLAALAGVLLAPLLNSGDLNTTTLTLLIVNAFAAAMLGRLRSLPLTALGGLLLGLLVTYGIGYLPSSGFLAQIQSVIPMVFLFLILIVLPHERLRSGGAQSAQRTRVPSFQQSLVGAAALIAAGVVASRVLSGSNLGTASYGMAFALILLSLTLLVGYGGMISLCQLTFVGLGAYAMAHVGHGGSLLGVLAAIGLSAGAGALLALPTLRLRGLHLALATLAFAAAMDGIFFDQRFGSGGSLTVDRVHIPGIPTSSDRAFLVLLCVVFAAGMVGLLSLRRSRIGRRLLAISDSPQACATLGLNINWTKLAVFATSAGMAGLGGALLGGEQHSISAMDVTQLNSLSLLLLLLVGGRSSASGALVGAAVYAAFPALAAHFSVLRNVQLIATGGAAILVCRHPEGIVGMLKEQLRLVTTLVNGRRRYAASRAIEDGHAQLVG